MERNVRKYMVMPVFMNLYRKTLAFFIKGRRPVAVLAAGILGSLTAFAWRRLIARPDPVLAVA